MPLAQNREIPAIVVQQWLQEWNEVSFIEKELRRRPAPNFYLFSLPAQQLRRLSKVYRRKADRPRNEDVSIQRQHDPSRSEEIRRYVHGGFPWSDLSDTQKRSGDFRDLRMPGWLPTAIIANILPIGTQRGNQRVSEQDAIFVEKVNDSLVTLRLPEGVGQSSWSPKVPPIEIIDGQHRLWAFEGDEEIAGAFSLPVVAFYDLDITWQAYLFYTINIKPKRINASLAFDLYPLLRIQDWLEKSPIGPVIYRETRAQELTEVLWAHPQSPWHNRINMLGERKSGPVTQAAFIRSLLASFVKKIEGKGVAIGGLFGAELDRHSHQVLQWNRPQQAAFLISIWQLVAQSVQQCTEEWAQSLRAIPKQPELWENDLAFSSEYSLLSTDQGVRGVFQIMNDICYITASDFHLSEWQLENDQNEEGINLDTVTSAMNELLDKPIYKFLENTAMSLTKFDWRTSSTPGLNNIERKNQSIFRGSSGYKELRMQLLEILISQGDHSVTNAAQEVKARLGY